MRMSFMPMVGKCRASLQQSKGAINAGSKYSAGGTAWHEVAERLIQKQPVNVNLISAKYGVPVETVTEALEAFQFLKKMGEPEEGHLHVYDWKTGWMEVDDPERNLQLIGYGLGATTMRDQLLPQAVHTESQIKYYHATGHPDLVIIGPGEITRVTVAIYYTKFREFRPHTFPIEELLEEWGPAVREIQDEALADDPEYTTGEHCSYCPGKPNCPALHKELLALGLNDPAISVRITDLSPSEAGRVYTAAKQAEKALASIFAAFRLYAETRGPVKLPNGKEWGTYEGEGNRKIDVVKGWDVLRARIPSHIGTCVKVSVGEVEKAAKANARADIEEMRKNKVTPPKGYIGKCVAALFNELERFGAISRPKKTFCGVIPEENDDD